MDINSLNTQTLFSPSRLPENILNLKVGQQLEVIVTNTDSQAANNAMILTLDNKDITVQSNQPLSLSTGQNLKIQVSQIAPAIEFKIIAPLQQATELRLKFIPTVATAIGRETNASSLPVRQPLDATIISIIGNKIQLQIINPHNQATVGTGDNQISFTNIDRSQLSNAPLDLKIGQNLNLEIIKTGNQSKFRIIPPSNSIPEAKIAEFIKQFLPRHEASPIFLNQLIKDFPQLIKNESVSETLKDVATKIIQNLPPKEQLITSQGLKQSINNSGLFLEAKLSGTMTQTEFINELPHLINNSNIPLSLRHIAAEILQNLTQKLPLSTNISSEQAISSKLNTEANTLRLEEVGQHLEQPANLQDDFKANLLKFIQTLKQEINHQNEQPLNQTDLDLLKNLQNKTENTVAKIVLDQLVSLPNDNNPKQVWRIDIPFIDRQQTETVNIEIQQDKENKKQSASGDWSVHITITPPKLDTIHCIVSYRNAVINTFFKSQNIQTTELIKHNLDYLKKQLEESGLTMGQMDAHAGKQKTQMPLQLTGERLFDENA